MMNLKIRWQNKAFWVTAFSFILLVVKYIASMAGYTLDIGPLNEIIDAFLLLMTAGGIIIDPTTPGVTDSTLVMEKTNIEQSGTLQK